MEGNEEEITSPREPLPRGPQKLLGNRNVSRNGPPRPLIMAALSEHGSLSYLSSSIQMTLVVAHWFSRAILEACRTVIVAAFRMDMGEGHRPVEAHTRRLDKRILM